MTAYYITLYNVRDGELATIATRPTEYARAKRIAIQSLERRTDANRVVISNMRTGARIGEYAK